MGTPPFTEEDLLGRPLKRVAPDQDDIIRQHFYDVAVLQAQINALQSALARPFYAFDANTYSSYGSTANKIPSFLNVVTSEGSGSIYAYDTSDGDKWTFSVDGNVVMCAWFSADNVQNIVVGISLNSTQLTTSIEAISTTDRKTIAYMGPQTDACVSCALKITSGDVLRVHTNGTIPSSTGQCGVNFIFQQAP